jgi:hypothetical protein
MGAPRARRSGRSAWRLLTVFEAPDRCIPLLVAEHTRSANPYRLLYAALGIDEPENPRTKPSCGTARCWGAPTGETH